ncbi:homoprotocatechuate degradation regulator HpaR [Pseudochelatococcus lubricantis]|uniref:Homoprotocatechuate degradation regulator HpaR n=1 Tax=Pseudochelatococcus lubricantis TaxID=1538102 RepID=A0ABX0V6L1_9HYPH|nr:homoprotocatechuate degradation regulator HpaR [Pseudochelatococcus lubricantis]
MTDPMSAEAPETAAEPGASATRVRLRDFSKSLPMSLLKAREAVMRHFRASLRRFGITEQQWRVLRALTAVESIEISQLAEVTFLLPPSLSRILKDLDERGLILRRASDTDMRRGLVSISPQGLELIERAGVDSEEIYGEITGRFGAERLTLLHALLRELVDCLDGAAIGTSVEDDTAVAPGAGKRRGRPRKAPDEAGGGSARSGKPAPGRPRISPSGRTDR